MSWLTVYVMAHFGVPLWFCDDLLAVDQLLGTFYVVWITFTVWDERRRGPRL